MGGSKVGGVMCWKGKPDAKTGQCPTFDAKRTNLGKEEPWTLLFGGPVSGTLKLPVLDRTCIARMMLRSNGLLHLL